MKFKELMKKGRGSTRLLGKAMGKSYTTVCAWCTGKSVPNVNDLIKLAELFNVPVEQVVACFAKEKQPSIEEG